MDILTGDERAITKNGRAITKKDFNSDGDLVPTLGKVEATDEFLINGQLGGDDPQGEWHSVDQIRFDLMQPLTLNLSLDPQTITEVVQFDSAGNASVVGSIEYGSSLQLELAPGQYELSLFVEGGQIDYLIAGQFV
jgi:hypothetical protein